MMALTITRNLFSSFFKSNFHKTSFKCISNDIRTFTDTETLRMANGDKFPCGLFSKGEIDTRITKLRSLMEEKGIAACLFTSIHNVNYFSGFVYCAFGRPYGLLITPDKHVTISALIDAGQPWRRSPYDNIIYTDWKRDNFYRAIAKELGDARGPLGIERDHVTLEVAHKLRNDLPHGNALVDVGAHAMRMRMKKSEEEIAVTKTWARGRVRRLFMKECQSTRCHWRVLVP